MVDILPALKDRVLRCGWIKTKGGGLTVALHLLSHHSYIQALTPHNASHCFATHFYFFTYLFRKRVFFSCSFAKEAYS